VAGKLLESRRVFFALVVLCLLPIVTALSVDVALREARDPSLGDIAALELRVLDASAGRLKLGAYSRFGWQHPGPAYLYAMVPLYLATGKQSFALHTAAALLCLLFAALIARELWLLVPEPLARIAALGPIAILLFDLQLAAVPSGFTEPWNPIVAVLPFALLVLICARVGQGNLRALPYAVLIHAVVGQAHLGYLALSTAILALAGVLGFVHRDRSERNGFRPWLYAGLAALLCWLLPLWDQLAGSHNLTAIVRFARRVAGQPLSEVPALFLERLGRPLATLLRFDHLSEKDALARGAGIALLVGSLGFIAWTRFRRERAPLVGFVLSVFPVAVVLLQRIESEPHEYLTLWVGVLAMILLSVMLAFTANLSPKAAPPLAALSAVLALLLAFTSSLSTVSRHRKFARTMAPDRARARGLIAEAERFRNRRPGEPVRLLISDNDAWGEIAPLVVVWEKRSVPALIDPRYRFLFGAYRHYNANAGRELSIATELRHDRPLFARVQDRYLFGPDEEPTRTHADARPRLAATERIKGNAASVLDGVWPREGSAWDSPGTAILEGTEARLTLEQPMSLSDGIELLGDGNDEYRVEVSVDARSWEPWLTIPPAPGWGLRRRSVAADRPRPVAQLRVSPVSGDGLYSIAELAVRTRGPAVAVVRARGSQGDVSLISDGQAPKDGSEWDAPGAVVLSRDFELELIAPAPGISGFEVIGDSNDYLIVEAVSAKNQRSLIGELPESRGRGIQHRRFWINAPLERFVLRAGQTDGLISIAEILPFPSQRTVVDVGSVGAHSALGKGWSGDEIDVDGASYRWIDGTRASVRYFAPVGVAHSVTLSCWPYEVDNRPQRLRARIAGESLLDWELSPGPQEVSFEVPASLARGEVELTLELAWAISPAALGRAADPRALSMGVDSVVVSWEDRAR
jgi:hypothetical protein